MPFFSDQIRTLGKSIKLGVAVFADFRDLGHTETKLKAAILSIVENSKYAENSKRIAKLFRDKPQKPLQLASWWVDYVIRNPNLDNLKSPTLNLGVFASNSYDVLLVLIVFLHIFVFIFVKIVKIVFKLRKSKKKTE